jgi:dienelactone hydrolase
VRRGDCFVSLTADRPAGQQLREETWALMTPLPVLAYVVRPVGEGPFPLLIMNHGISGDAQQRGFFPMVEYRDAAHWFARRGYFVVSPVRYGAVSTDEPERGMFSLYFAEVGDLKSPTFAGRD